MVIKKITQNGLRKDIRVNMIKTILSLLNKKKFFILTYSVKNVGVAAVPLDFFKFAFLNSIFLFFC